MQPKIVKKKNRTMAVTCWIRHQLPLRFRPVYWNPLSPATC